MEKTQARLHPLLTAAAIALTVFSAVGVATLTGLVPPSIGSQKEEIIQPAEIFTPIEPAITHPVAKPAKKPVARTSKSRPAEPVVSREFATVQAVREVKQPGEHTAMGPIAGGVAGAVLGSQIGGGSGKKVMTVLGALGGAMAGKHIEKQARSTTRWEIEVRHDSGAQETVLSDVAPPYGAGDRVRVVDGRLQPA
jgi:outer membrane lipoprotein SlyB